MTVLVVGATGKTGRLVVEQLLCRNYEVRVIVRSPDSLPSRVLENPNTTVIEASILDLVLSELRAQGLFDARSKVPLTSICIRAFRIYCFCDGEYWGFSGLSAEF